MTANDMFITEERYNSSIYVVTRQQDSNKDTIMGIFAHPPESVKS